LIKALLKVAVDHAVRFGAPYAEARYQDLRTEDVSVKNGAVNNADRGRDRGVGVRVVWDGAYGFASTNLLTPEELRRTAARALGIAKAASTVQRGGLILDELEAYVGYWPAPYEIHPFEVPLDKKVELLLEATEALRVADEIKIAEGFIHARETHKVFVSSIGSEIEQRKVECGAGISCTAVRGNEMQRRSYPDSARGFHQSRGWEHVLEMKLVENAPQCAKEVLELLDAEEPDEGEADLVIDGSQMMLQIHESCGHAVELDRVLGQEASFAGTSFLTTDKRGSYIYGSPLVNIYADATIPHSLGYCAFDDEGVPAQKFYVVKDGVFCDYLSTRDTAHVYGGRSHGAARAQSWSDFPICRMTNICLEPGEHSPEELIAGVDKGYYLVTNKSWSIDDKRLNFQFGVEYARRIENGKLGAVVKNIFYADKTPRFWGSCDGIGDAASWKLWGTPNCGKGEPMQVMRISHGTPPARFRGVKVGVAK
jgi:TldD protein